MSISPLDGEGSPTGQVFATQTTSDLGEFAVSLSYQGLTAIQTLARDSP